MNKLKVMTVLGTRPEIIRLSRVMARLDDFTDHVIVHTGQNYDYELNELFFEELQVRSPDYFLGVGGGSLGETLGKILSETEKVLLKEKPDAFLILGDTNSAISAIIARRMKIPVYHMEAGNRSFDKNVPEELNRKMVDHISDFNLVYTEHARRHLLSEGLPHRRINLTGSPMKEVLNHHIVNIDKSKVLQELELEVEKYFVVSLHREENVDNEHRLRSLMHALNELAEQYNYPLIMSTHPRTRTRLNKFGINLHNLIQDMKPFGFFDYNKLQKSAYCTLSDSGTIAEESSILNFPAITPRDSIERPEGIDVGCIINTGVEVEAIIFGVETARKFYEDRLERGLAKCTPVDYQIDNTSERVVSLVIGTARLSNAWDGIRSND